jgi:hypothetical protein
VQVLVLFGSHAKQLEYGLHCIQDPGFYTSYTYPYLQIHLLSGDRVPSKQVKHKAKLLS